MQVAGRELFDPTGARVLLRGVNKMNVYTDHHGDVSFPEIESTGANTVRIVWATATDDFVPTAADLDTVIGNALAHHLIPMPELHDATGNFAGLSALVDYWTRPDILAVVRKHERWLLVNIGNEVGDDQVTAAQFLAGYTTAVQRMRAAGVRSPLVVDASDWGKNLDVLVATGAALTAADPLHALLFSAHLYWPLHDGADATFIHEKLAAAVDAGLPLVVGEFSRYGAYAGDASICSEAGEVDYATILAETARDGIGWYAWEWGPGNVGGGDPLCTVMDMTTASTLATLQAGWATDVVEGPYGIRTMSIVPATIGPP
jgi:mannan endo-1,4-beta-mannosidase